MKKLFAYLSLLIPAFALANVAEIRLVLEEDFKMNVAIAELKKESKQLEEELELAMQNTRALIEAYDLKTQKLLAQKEEQNFKKNLTISKITAATKNLKNLSENIDNIYQKFLENLEEIPPALRQSYLEQIAAIDAYVYADLAEKSLAKLKFLSQILADANSCKFLGENCLAFGLNAEFYKDSKDANVSKLFKILAGESSYEILELKIEKGSK